MTPTTTFYVRSNASAEAAVAGDMIAQMYLAWLWRIGAPATMTTTRVSAPMSSGATVSRKIVCHCDPEIGAEFGVHRVVRIGQTDAERRRYTAMVQVNGRDAALPRDAKIIRSYVLDPYHLVRDERSRWETKDVLRVLSGDIDEMMKAARAAGCEHVDP